MLVENDISSMPVDYFECVYSIDHLKNTPKETLFIYEKEQDGTLACKLTAASILPVVLSLKVKLI